MSDYQAISALTDLLIDYPDGISLDKPWNYQLLSANQSLSSQFVADHVDRPWDRAELLCNPAIELDLRLSLLPEVINSPDFYLKIRRVILDIPVLRFILENMDSENFYEEVSHNNTLTPEVIEWLYESEWIEQLNPLLIQCTCSAEVLQWFISNHPEEVDNGALLINDNLTEEIIDWLLTRGIDNYELLQHGKMADARCLKMINEEDFDITDNRMILEILKNSDSVEITERLLELDPQVLDRAVLREELPLIAMSEERLIELFIDTQDINILRNISIADPVLLGIIRNNRKIPKNELLMAIKTHYCMCHREISSEVLMELDKRGYDLSELNSILKTLIYITLEGDVHIYMNYNGKIILKVEDIPSLECVRLLILNSPSKAIVRLDIEINNQAIEHLKDSGSHCLDWGDLSERAHQDYILAYPDLPWNMDILSKRKYHPSTRFMKTKSAKK